MRKLITLAMALSMVAAMAISASADDVYIDLITNPGADEVTLDLADGSPQTGSVTLAYLETNDDNKRGCNLQGADSQVRFDVTVTTVSGTAPTLDKSVVTFPDCTNPQAIGISATAPGVIGVTLAYKDHVSGTSGLTSADWNSAGAAFSVTVIDSTPVASLDAPEIANSYLGARADNSDCKANWGTNKNNANWHGSLISAVAKKWQGQTFTNATKAEVENAVEAACGTRLTL